VSLPLHVEPQNHRGAGERVPADSIDRNGPAQMIKSAPYAFYNQEDPDRWGRDEMSRELDLVRHYLASAGKDTRRQRVLELGCGKGALQTVHPNYIGLDISFIALKSYLADGKRVQANAHHLPIKTGSVDFLFSFATLEHVPQPELALDEIHRVLAKDGVAVVAPAWFCRRWAAQGLPVRPYHQLGWADRIRKLLIPLRDHILWRSFWVLPRRILRELACWACQGTFSFSYERLNPNLDEYIYTDCDAFSSMDPHAAILFFKSRGYRLLSAPRLIDRLLVRNEPVIIQK
jgi:SAM-dependent methyltransferase